MSIHGLAAIAVRLTGIIVGLYSVKIVASYIYTATLIGAAPISWLTNLYTFATVAASVFMIAFPRLIAGNLIPTDPAASKATPVTEIDFEGLACTLVGLYFLVQSAIDATYLISFWLASTQLETRWVWTEHFIAMIATTVAEFLISIWILFRARGLMGLLRWARNYDTRMDDQNA